MIVLNEPLKVTETQNVLEFLLVSKYRLMFSQMLL